jgi:hypothetical protein
LNFCSPKDEEQQTERSTTFGRIWNAITLSFEMAGFEVPDIRELTVENHVVDTQDLPKAWVINSFTFYQAVFWALAAFFFAQNYELNRTSTFISLDNTAGVCLDDKSQDTCCEVAKGITGTLLLCVQ